MALLKWFWISENMYPVLFIFLLCLLFWMGIEYFLTLFVYLMKRVFRHFWRSGR